MIEVNLIPDVKLELIKTKRIRTKVVTFSIAIGVVAAGIVAVLVAYAFGVQTVRGVIDDNNVTSEYKKLSQVTDLPKVLTIQDQLSKISSLNDAKKIDSRLFDILSVIIPGSPNQIQISSLSVDANAGTISIDGQAQNSYAALETFKKTISNTKVSYSDDGTHNVSLASNIVTSNTSYGEDSSGGRVLRFTLAFNYAKELFASTSDNVTVSVDKSGNVTDSYLGVPTSIFTTKAVDITGGEQ